MKCVVSEGRAWPAVVEVRHSAKARLLPYHSIRTVQPGFTGSQTRPAACPCIRARCVHPRSERAIIWWFDCRLAGRAREWIWNA